MPQPIMHQLKLIGLHAACTSLGIAWKLAVSAFALAIILGMVAEPAAHSGKPSSAESHPIRLERTGNLCRILTQLPAGKDSLEMELFDPRGKKSFYLLYGKDGIMNFYSSNCDRVFTGYTTRPGGGERVHIRTPATLYSVGLHSNGDSNVLVTTRGIERKPLGEIRVSPNGTRQPDREKPDAL